VGTHSLKMLGISAVMSSLLERELQLAKIPKYTCLLQVRLSVQGISFNRTVSIRITDALWLQEE
jgi:hypothetical protein